MPTHVAAHYSRYVGVAFLAAMWKWYYYAPNTYKQLKIAQLRKDGHTVSEEDAHAPFTLPVSQHAHVAPCVAQAVDRMSSKGCD